MEKETVNARIRQIIEKEGHTISSFARKSELGDQTIRSIVKDRNKPSFDVLVKIVENFDWVDANWLVMGQKTKNEDLEGSKLYAFIDAQQKTIEAQQKTIEAQQKTIERLTDTIIRDVANITDKKIASTG